MKTIGFQRFYCRNEFLKKCTQKSTQNRSKPFRKHFARKGFYVNCNRKKEERQNGFIQIPCISRKKRNWKTKIKEEYVRDVIDLIRVREIEINESKTPFTAFINDICFPVSVCDGEHKLTTVELFYIKNLMYFQVFRTVKFYCIKNDPTQGEVGMILILFINNIVLIAVWSIVV